MSSQGYINFCGGTKSDYYTKELFDARRKTFELGLFAPICDRIASVIDEKLGSRCCTLLDAGCGEGSALNDILSILNNGEDSRGVNGIGADISKEGIKAATSYRSAIWLVSDIAGLPLMDSSVDFLINILAPANYSEFARTVKKGGYVIKVVPGEDYLMELRTLVSGTREDSQYDRNAAELFTAKFGMDSIEEHELRYDFLLSDNSSDYTSRQNDILSSIVEMTPLCRNINKTDELKHIPESVCVHVKILVAKLK